MYDRLYKSLFEVVSFFIRPKQDKLLMEKAGISLDTALFPLLMRIAHEGPLDNRQKTTCKCRSTYR